MDQRKLKDEIKEWKAWIRHEQKFIDKCEDEYTLQLLNIRKESAKRILSELNKLMKELKDNDRNQSE